MIDLGGQDGAPVLGLGGGMFKASIILFDTIPGTKEFTVPEGVKKIRAFVIGPGGIGGGGYSEKSIDVVAGQKFAYTVGVGSKGSAASTSSFGGLISASGGMVLGGVGLGGDVNFNGGNGTALSGSTVVKNSGGSAATRYCDGGAGGITSNNGAHVPGDHHVRRASGCNRVRHAPRPDPPADAGRTRRRWGCSQPPAGVERMGARRPVQRR